MNSSAAGSFTDHPRKVLFRRNWAKPIIQYIHNRLNKKLVYLGLPGIKCLDVIEWKEYLASVIAFQVENYQNRLTPEQSDQELTELISILNDLEAKREIDTYAVFVGYIEEVVMSEFDNNQEPLILNDYITIFNLDFCNTLTKPYQVINSDTSVTDYYKKDVIDKLLSIQKGKFNLGYNASFVMFLTVNSGFVEKIVADLNDATIKEYIKTNLKGVNKQERLVRLLKAYTFYILTKIFHNHGFHVELLPVIYYQGSGTWYDPSAGVDRPTWLVTFTVLGTPVQINNPSISFKQDFKTYLEEKFIFINDSKISCFTDAKIKENEVVPDINKILSESNTITKLWIPNPQSS